MCKIQFPRKCDPLEMQAPEIKHDVTAPDGSSKREIKVKDCENLPHFISPTHAYRTPENDTESCHTREREKFNDLIACPPATNLDDILDFFSNTCVSLRQKNYSNKNHMCRCDGAKLLQNKNERKFYSFPRKLRSWGEKHSQKFFSRGGNWMNEQTKQPSSLRRKCLGR